MKIIFWSIVIGDDHGYTHTKLFHEEQLALDHMEEMENDGNHELILSEKPVQHSIEIDEDIEVIAIDGKFVDSSDSFDENDDSTW